MALAQAAFPVPEVLDISPAYGRAYGNNEAALADWIAGKDFKIMHGGPYLSIRDSKFMKQSGVRAVMIWIGLREGVEVNLA